MSVYNYRIVNVFADATAAKSKLTGNPLCVFEDARGMDDATMQALALQFNLSESVFVLPSDIATARIRIFTTAFEMPFAGHPTLGSAHVVRALKNSGDAITLETGAGVIPVNASGDTWTLKANAPKTRAYTKPLSALAKLLGINKDDIADTPLWVNTGTEQLIVPLASAAAVRRCHVAAEGLIAEKATNPTPKVLAWANLNEGDVLARFFLLTHDAVREDFGTGSAAANLGGWHVARNAALPIRRVIHQGEPINRPARLRLDVHADQGIYVGGLVVELGRGAVTL